LPSKYDAILPKLKDLPPQDPAWQAKVDLVKHAIINDPKISKSPSNLARMFAAARNAKDKLEADLYDANTDIEALTQMLVESQEEAGAEWGTYGAQKNMLRLVSGDKIEVRREPYATVKDKDALREWAVKNELQRLLSIHHKTLEGLVRERLMKGDAEPDGVEVFVKKKIIFTKMKTGEK
jgi:hypothetical protein